MYAEDIECFLEMLRAFLREGRFEPVKSSDEMLRLFGTHLNDGKSVERAVAALREIVGMGSRKGRLTQQDTTTS